MIASLQHCDSDFILMKNVLSARKKLTRPTLLFHVYLIKEMVHNPQKNKGFDWSFYNLVQQFLFQFGKLLVIKCIEA